MKSNLVRCMIILVALSGALLLAACAPASTPTTAPLPTTIAPTTAPTAPPTLSAAGLTEVTVVMGYIPDVQFAPWYVAEKKGYFNAEGLKVKFTWGFEVDGIKLVGANQADFALLGGDQVIQARAQDIPLVYVANFYNGFPSSVFSLKEKNIKTPKDLVGKKVGLPAFWGANYTGWRALLYGAGIKESDVTVQDIGFAQVAALTQGIVDAAVGYSNNEPVQLALAGKEINVIQVADFSKLVGIGLVTNEKTVAEKPQLAQKMVRAFLRGLQDTIANPQDALAISVQNLPEAGGQNLPKTEAVLKASIKLWTSPRLGYVDPADWAASAKFMKDAGFIKSDIDVTKAYTNMFLQ
ncbi:MAG: ABC transporter substrate-binding protein [Chloroflexi bacterium]|nr:ABC transporter substrate-binding protein [Chloroflexota bacterium]